jgi:hypothetical protein
MWWRQSGQRHRVPRRIAGLIAVGCALILLFPIISESDDLHAFRPEMEDVSFKAAAGKAAKAVSTHSAHSLCSPPRIPAVSAELQVAGNVIPRAILKRAWRTVASSCPRSPPFSSV